MGKVTNRCTAVASRRRYPKVSAGKKGRGSRVPLPSQSLVLDEDSGFGGDASLDSESSLHAPLTSAAPATLPSVLPSLAMVPQTKLLLVSLLQGGVGQGTPSSQKSQANVAAGASPPSTQPTFSNGTNQIGSTHGTVAASGAEPKQWTSSHTHLLAAPSRSLRGATHDVVCELPAATSTSTFPSTRPPTGPVARGSTGHKVGTTQARPASHNTKHHIPGTRVWLQTFTILMHF